jgi:hypothetical protein
MPINAYCTVRKLPELDFPHQLVGHRDRTDPALVNHLRGFHGYLRPRDQMSSARYALLRHVERVVHQLSLEIDDSALEPFGLWLEKAHGVAFWPDGSVRDSSGRLLFHPSGEVDELARLPISATAQRRKVDNHRRLSSEGIPLPEHLPTVIDEDEALPRQADEVAKRALALFLVALRAESLDADEPVPASEMEERQPLGFASLSPAEREFMLDPRPSPQVVAQMSWRYEALLVLLWSLGRFELPPPTSICDVQAMASMLIELDEDEFVAQANLRYTPILLDALDLHFRYHWAVRQASVDGAEPPGGLVPGVVLERHYALNWLTRCEESDWDDVGTPT